MQRTVVKNRFISPPCWRKELLTSNAIFADICQQFSLAQQSDWPDLNTLNQWRSDHRFSFADSNALAADGRYYEEYIYATGQIPSRDKNWHDFFGALIWCLFPQTKALLNQLHMAEIGRYGLQHRSLLRNKLTLFDECGVLICLEPAALDQQQLLCGHQWQQSFVTQRAQWWQQIRPMVFGHAIYEMATVPFIGLTAKALFIAVPEGFCHWSLTDAYSLVDGILHQQIANESLLLDNKQLTPLPLLGVPGWYNDNEIASFYHNTDYFRPQRSTMRP